VTVTVSGVEARAFVPCPVDAIPEAVARLQLQAFDLDDPAPLPVVDPVPGGPLVVSICPDPVLPTGKAAAAAGHAAQLARMRMPADRVAGWAGTGFAVVVEHPGADRWIEVLWDAPVVVADAGYTVVSPGTVTAVARWA
jgi:peptidyl-tRNA hydrolase